MTSAGLLLVAGILGFVVWPKLKQQADSQNQSPTDPPPPAYESVANTEAFKTDTAVSTALDSLKPSGEPNSDASLLLARPNRDSSPQGLQQAAKGKSAETGGDILAAREHYSLALKQGLPEAEEADVRRRLVRISEETLLSRKRVPNDPLTRIHTIASGETLQRIAKRYKVSSELLASINGIENPNFIRKGQRVKVVDGPFHAVVHKSRYILQIFLHDVLVIEYPVGLGADDSTPTGRWKVKPGDKLVNPTFYPPPSIGGPIINADDPENPLGEYWIGLVGISGDAVGQESYGIHGTIEPESIGTSSSAGCIRMHNDDVASVYAMLVGGHSHVTVLP